MNFFFYFVKSVFFLTKVSQFISLSIKIIIFMIILMVSLTKNIITFSSSLPKIQKFQFVIILMTNSVFRTIKNYSKLIVSVLRINSPNCFFRKMRCCELSRRPRRADRSGSQTALASSTNKKISSRNF